MVINPRIIARIRRAWSAESALDPQKWTPERPEADQCAVTACLLHDEFGMRIVRGQATLPDGSVESHYWCEDVDLTIGQFPPGTRIEARKTGPQGKEAYAYLLSNPDLRRRYEILRSRYLAAA